MKLAIYHEHEGNLATVYEELNNPRITENELTFDKGAISGINDNHILLEDEITPPGTLEEAKLLDQKAQYIVEQVDEVADLKTQLQTAREENEMNALAIMELAELVLGG